MVDSRYYELWYNSILILINDAVPQDTQNDSSCKTVLQGERVRQLREEDLEQSGQPAIAKWYRIWTTTKQSGWL